MTKIELRASKAALEAEKQKLNEKFIVIRDRKVIQEEKIRNLRMEETQHLEAIKVLTPNEANKIAKKVLNDKVVQVRIQLEEAQKVWETIQSEFAGMEGKITNLDKSIKELASQ